MNSFNFADDLVPLAGIFAIFIMPMIMFIFIAWFKTKQKSKQDKLKAELIAKAIENGQTIPDNLFETKEKKTSLQKGITWTTIGAGIALFFVFMGIAENDYKQTLQGVGISMIFIFLGIGYLLVHFTGKKQKNDSDK
ncbi:MAG: DUF6249 domain-containing protein [Prevotellaceae bacterium]|jgi:ACR3 family arsenite efflux pump ArsB|nr:DUF6249 domain-containing protein [Prevotellaceae bacterium]